MMDFCGRGYGYGNGFGYGMMHGGGFPMMLLWIALIGIGIYFLVKYLRKPSYSHGFSHSYSRNPMDILKERYAKGEISEEEFEEKRRRLHQES